MLSRKLLVSAIAALVSAPTLVSADSELAIGGGGTQAQANLDFQIVIPDFVYFSIGSTGATIDRVDFDLLAGTVQPGPGGPLVVAATGGTGDGFDGILDVQLITNVTNVSIAAATVGGVLTSGLNTIPFTQINGVAGGAIPIPAFDTSGNLATGGPVTLNDTWTYTYNNDTVFAPGTYTGRVTYTVTTP
jgi:hypothetical protein